MHWPSRILFHSFKLIADFFSKNYLNTLKYKVHKYTVCDGMFDCSDESEKNNNTKNDTSVSTRLACLKLQQHQNVEERNIYFY